MIGIYKITSPTNKIYIGRSKNVERRFKQYFWKNGAKYQVALLNSFKKHGVENHIFEIIEECLWEEINIRERYWQDYYDVLGRDGLNCQLTKTNEKPHVFTKETLEKLNKPKSEQGRINIALGQKNRKKDSLETKKKKSASRLGMVFSGDHLDAMRKSQWNNKEVLDLQTGIYYISGREAARAYNIKENRISFILSSKYRNNTNLVWADNYNNIINSNCERIS